MRKKNAQVGPKIESSLARYYKHTPIMSVLASEFDASKVTFGELKVLGSGAKSVNLSYDGRPLVMQLSNLDVPYGLNTDDKYGPVKYSVNLSLRDFDSNPKVKAVFDALEGLDTRVMDECVAKNWLKKPGMTQPLLKQMKLYKSTVKFSEDQNGNRKPYPPTVKVALRKMKDDRFETVFYDQDKKEIKDVPVEDLIVKRMNVTVLVECTSVWISSVGCGLSWKAKQLKVVSKPDGFGRGYGFRDDDEPASSSSGAKPTSSSSKPAASSFAAAFDEDDEVDEEAVVAETPVVEQEATPLKKVIKKKIVLTGGK